MLKKRELLGSGAALALGELAVGFDQLADSFLAGSLKAAVHYLLEFPIEFHFQTPVS